MSFSKFWIMLVTLSVSQCNYEFSSLNVQVKQEENMFLTYVLKR